MCEEKKHPIQPLGMVGDVLRFKENKIVRRLLDEGGIDMNQIATWDVPREDREQFAQLIGYSHSGFGDLSYASDETYESSYRMYERGETEEQARANHAENLLNSVRERLQTGIAELYGIHPDDLWEKCE